MPELVPQLAEVIGFIVTTMGLRDKMLDSKSTIIAKLIDVKSRTFIGALIVGISYIVDNVGSMPIPEKYVPVIQIFGALLTAMGIRDAKGKQLRKGVA